jgi:hypothetical protein
VVSPVLTHAGRATSIQDSSGICDPASARLAPEPLFALARWTGTRISGSAHDPRSRARAGALRGCSTRRTLPLAGTPDLGRSRSRVFKRSKTGVASP